MITSVTLALDDVLSNSLQSVSTDIFVGAKTFLQLTYICAATQEEISAF